MGQLPRISRLQIAADVHRKMARQSSRFLDATHTKEYTDSRPAARVARPAQLLLAEALRFLDGEGELLHQLLVALVRRQVQPVEAVAKWARVGWWGRGTISMGVLSVKSPPRTSQTASRRQAGTAVRRANIFACRRQGSQKREQHVPSVGARQPTFVAHPLNAEELRAVAALQLLEAAHGHTARARDELKAPGAHLVVPRAHALHM